VKAMTFRSLMSVLELADDDHTRLFVREQMDDNHTRLFVREQMMTATLDDLLEIR
jgi:hypothetical protein